MFVLALALRPSAPRSSDIALSLRPGFDVIAEAESGTRQLLPDTLRELWPQRFTTSTAAKQAVRRKLVQLGDCDGSGARLQISDVVAPGCKIKLLARVAPGPVAGEGRRAKSALPPLQTWYEDDHIAVVQKPAGLSVQGDVRERLVASLTPTRARHDEPLWRPQHVHRLDTPTSGLLLVAKTGVALRTLSASFAARRVHKTYRALVWTSAAARVEDIARVNTLTPLVLQQKTPVRVLHRMVQGLGEESGRPPEAVVMDTIVSVVDRGNLPPQTLLVCSRCALPAAGGGGDDLLQGFSLRVFPTSG